MPSTPPAVPFLTGQEVCRKVTSLHPNAPLARVLLCDLKRLTPDLPKKIPLWIDPGIDGLDDLAKSTPSPKNKKKPNQKDSRQDWFDTITQFTHYGDIANKQFQKKPDKKKIKAFVAAALDAANAHKPKAISIPQLPHVNDKGRNKINIAMAKAAAEWQLDHHTLSLILPVILTNPKQSEQKTARNDHIDLAIKCVEASRAHGCWIVDSSFDDEKSSADLRRKRIKGLVDFHQEFNAKIADDRLTKIAGPYWGLNLLLWSRGLVDQFGIGVGTGYHYYISGSRKTQGTIRIAISPLYRRAKTGVELRSWIDAVNKQIGTSHPFHGDLQKLKSLATTSESQAKNQLATFYKDWIDKLTAAPPTGRAMTLFQSLSVAFSYGRQLDGDLDAEKATRAPESIVEPLMLNCL